MGASAIVVGAPLIINNGKPVSPKEFKQVLEDLVKKVSKSNI